MTNRPIGDLAAEMLSETYSRSDACPAIEKIAAAANGELEPTDMQAIERHVADCPACSAENLLAQAYVKGPTESADADTLAALVQKLEASQDSNRNVVRFPQRWRQAVTPLVSLAAAATIAVAVLPTLFVSGPGLPDRGDNTTFRSSSIAVHAPTGDLDAVPETFSWNESADARVYRISVRAVDRDVIWDATVTTQNYQTPMGLAEKLVPAVTYTWQVEALDDKGNIVARSEPVSIRIKPGR